MFTALLFTVFFFGVLFTGAWLDLRVHHRKGLDP
jgi:hypothetical protein